MSLESTGVSSNSLQTLESLKINVLKKQDSVTQSENTEPKEQTIKILKDKVSLNILKGTVPKVETHISNALSSQKKEDPVDFIIKGKVFQAYPVIDGVELADATNITKGNEIDEVFIKDEEGKLYVAYGDKDTKGALNVDGLKEGYIGKINGKSAKIVKIDNEVNTVKEGFQNPLKSTWNSVKESGSTSISRGIGDIGGSIVAIVLSGSVIKNIATASSTVGEAAKVVDGGVKVSKAIIDVGKAAQTGKAIAFTVGSGLKQGAKYTVIATAVIGTVALGFSAYGAIKAKNPKNDYDSIDMLTDPDLAFKLKPAATPATPPKV